MQPIRFLNFTGTAPIYSGAVLTALNTRTTITIDWLKIAEAIGFGITLLSAFPYSSGQMAEHVPPAWKPYVLPVSFWGTILVYFWRAIPALPGNRPAGGAVGADEIKPAALVEPPPCPVCEKRKRAKKKAPK